MEEYEEILSRKLNPRDQAKVILDYTKTEIRRDCEKNSRTYNKLDHLDDYLGNGNGTALPDDEFNDVVSGLISKLDFSTKILLDRIMMTCNEMLLTACTEQGELMSFAIQEIKNSLMIFSSTIKNLHSIMLSILNEKNIFAGKALSLAKAVRSVYFHDLELTSLQPTVSYYTLLSDICIRNFVSIPLVLEKMFLNHGGTARCNRYSSKTEKNQSPLNGDPDDEPKSVTSVNDMVEYLDTTYTSKIMTQFVADVKVTVMSILSEMKAKAEMEERSKKLTEKLLKLAVVPVSHTAKSRHMVLSVENESEVLVQQMVFRRRNAAAFVIQCCYNRYKRRLRIRERKRVASAISISRFLKASRLKMTIFRRMLHTFSVKRACRMIRRNCLAYFLRERRRKSAAQLITRNLKKLWRNRSCYAIVILVKDLSRSIVQSTWATKWGDFEKRLHRVESFLEMCAPITIAQHALARSQTLALKSEASVEPDLFHKRLLTMAQWEWYHSEAGYEMLMEEHRNLFGLMCLPPESLEGFGTKDLVQSSLESFEERCSVYSIVGSSVLRYGTVPMTSIPHTRVTKVKPSTKTRAQTMNGNRKPRGDSNSSERLPRSSQKPVFRAAPPEESKPSQLHLRRTLVSPSSLSQSSMKSTHLRSSANPGEESDEKSLSSLALSGSDEDDLRRRRSTSRPKSKTKKFRSTFVAREASGSPFTAPQNRSRSSGSPVEINSSTQSLTTRPPEAPSSISKPPSVATSHREQLTNLMRKFRGLEDG